MLFFEERAAWLGTGTAWSRLFARQDTNPLRSIYRATTAKLVSQHMRTSSFTRLRGGATLFSSLSHLWASRCPLFARASVRMVVCVNAMIPKPGETAGAWWGATGALEARKHAAARRGYASI
jgi:hypothetical protein